ncbi:hemagglutinin [Myotis bat morbillivirus]|uniref:Hemagglutinin glycoprotein n=1 Tax=Myotis bat morbillivirus TaxID=2853286 RepID=A0A8K1LXN1_9MONO|nr:receptor binding protein [Cloning vector pEMC-MBaMV-eGFP]UBB97712.1 hemagglutinin [Myotis bat morbillivirus]
MFIPKDREDAFYKDLARAQKDLPNDKGRTQNVALWASSIKMMALVSILLVVLVCLVVIGMQRRVKECSDLSAALDNIKTQVSMVENQVSRTLVPMFKVISDEVGIRLPYSLSEIKQFILKKIAFLNPAKEFDFRELNWCINPPNRVKINYADYCDSYQSQALSRYLGAPYRRSFGFLESMNVLPPSECVGSVRSKGNRGGFILSLTTVGNSKKITTTGVRMVLDQGIYGKNYIAWLDGSKHNESSTKFRVFEVGTIRQWLGSDPVLHMTNYLSTLALGDVGPCVMAIGETQLVAVCFNQSIFVTSGSASNLSPVVTIVTLDIFGLTHSTQTLETTIRIAREISAFKIGDHRGVVVNGSALWVLPVSSATLAADREYCITALCTDRRLSNCPLPSSSHSDSALMFEQGLLKITLTIDSEPEVTLTRINSKLIALSPEYSVYRDPAGASVWVVTPPDLHGTLGTINRVYMDNSPLLVPHTPPEGLSGSEGKCYSPIRSPVSGINYVKLTSNLVVLPTKNLTYVTATYDTSRSKPAVVYHVYTLGNPFSYTHPFKTDTEGVPRSLTIDCFLFIGRIWCYQVYLMNLGISEGAAVIEDLVSLEYSCITPDL